MTEETHWELSMMAISGLYFLFLGCVKNTVSTSSTLEQQSVEATEGKTENSTKEDSSGQKEEQDVVPTTSVGVFDKGMIDKKIKSHMEGFSSCYTTSLRKNPDLGGRLMVKFVIEQDGSVSEATTTEDTLGSDEFKECVLEEFIEMQFPSGMKSDMVTNSDSLDARKIIISYPLLFTPE